MDAKAEDQEGINAMWERRGNRVFFTGGKVDYKAAAAAADLCALFAPDCEEECTADEERSCYNCRYRRWTSASFECVKGAMP